MEKTDNGSAIRQQIVSFIQQFRNERGFSPTQQEIACGVGTSPSNVYYHLKVLEKHGQITRKHRAVRALGIPPEASPPLFKGVPSTRQ